MLRTARSCGAFGGAGIWGAVMKNGYHEFSCSATQPCCIVQRMKKRRPTQSRPIRRIMVNLDAGQVVAVRSRALRDCRTMSAWIRNLILVELAK